MKCDYFTVIEKKYYYFTKGGYDFGGVCVSVCKQHYSKRTDCNEILWMDPK